MKKHTISTIVLAGLSILFLLVSLIMGIEEGTSFIFSAIILMLATSAFIALSLLKVNKMVILVPMLVSFVFIGIFESVSLFASSGFAIGATNSSPVLSLLITAALVVGIIYALMDKRWAAILTIVILGIEIATNAQLFIILLGFESVDYLAVMSVAIISLYSAFILYFIPIINKQKEE